LHPDAQLSHRADDNPETVQARLRTFAEQTRPLLDYYQSSDLLRRVDGTRAAQEIYGDIERIVTK
jgi:adenylate kinase family enzyme